LFKVDTDIWSVERFTCNKWEQGSKIEDRIIVTPLYQTKAFLIRKIAIAVNLPEFKTVQFTVKSNTKTVAKSASMSRVVVWPDIQAGFKRDIHSGTMEPLHDRRALDIALQITQYINPDRTIFLGDNLDLPEWTDHFVRSPDFNLTTQHSAVELSWWLSKVRQINSGMQIDYLEGNHDARMEKAICNYIGSAYDLRPADNLGGPPLLSIRRLLGLESLNIDYHGPYPHGRIWINDNLSLVHGETSKAGSGATGKALVSELRASEGMGHIHKVEMVCKTLWSKDGPKIYTAFSPGTLARLDPGIVPSKRSRNNWQQGLAVIDYEKGNGYFHIQLINIYDGVAIFGGRRWEARSEPEIVKEINSDLGSGTDIRF
jgi:hypothetical protein